MGIRSLILTTPLLIASASASTIPSISSLKATLEANIQAAVAKSYQIELTGFTGVYAALLIILGLVFAFYGFRFFKITLASVGFVGFGVLALSLIESTNLAAKHFGDKAELYSFLIAGVAGILGALLFLFIWRVGVIGIGAFGGFTLANFILSIRPNAASFIKHESANLFFIAFFILAFSILTIFFEKYIVIISTSLLGSFGLLLGIDIYAGSGFSAFAKAFAHAPMDLKLTNTAIGYIASLAVVAVVGIIFQIKISSQGKSSFSSETKSRI